MGTTKGTESRAVKSFNAFLYRTPIFVVNLLGGEYLLSKLRMKTLQPCYGNVAGVFIFPVP